ncbi:exosome complex exonuclease DIS3/RRP44 [Nematocida major]|uniref:exosome complex exonuclease DIS3/RRP44 n=1 Tax=Nematocida major TaxID=1912982 RepID=UPI002008BAD5|nr:exosome complex exonuclease DIS3/RRP44 [Nematocida major]KAH9387231.1 exosome complex exonuclease DIS3/RRP44 [Nematocida major]
MERINISYKQTKKGEVRRMPMQMYMQESTNCVFGCCGGANPRIQEQIGRSACFYILSDEFIHDFIVFIEEKALTNIIISRTAVQELKRKYMNTFRRLEAVIDRYNLPLIEDANSASVWACAGARPREEYYSGLAEWYQNHLPMLQFVAVHSRREGEGEIPSSMFTLGVGAQLPGISIEAKEPHARYWSREEIAELKDKAEFGPINIPDRVSGGAIVCNIEGHQTRIEVPREHLNRAIDNDCVVVEVVHEGGEKCIGRVVDVERRSRRPFPCTLLKRVDGAHVLLEPEMENLPTVLCCVPESVDLENKVLLAAVEEWPEQEEYPVGYLVKVTGEKDTIEAETAALLSHHSILDQPFEAAALQELPDETWAVSQQDLSEREDLREYPIASIDPEGCVDIDDALHAVNNPDGTIEVGVHIADVTHFVKADSCLDREGRIRGCTTYLPNRRIDMLPSLLGTNLCSLHKNVDRLAFSVIWRLRIEKDKVVFQDRRFAKTVIRSKESFTYDQASHALETGEYRSREILESIQSLKKVSRLLKKERLRTGAFMIHSDECRITARSAKRFCDISEDPGSHMITEEDHAEEHDTHSLVEEFMLLANQHVAEYISEKYPKESLIRVHPRPAQSSFKELEKALSHISGADSIRLDPHNPSELSRVLKECSSTPGLKSTIGAWATRCMTQAVYAPSFIGCKLHYGLAMENYTHFTSPIRRYADVVVHRQLHCAMHSHRYPPVTEARLEEICDSVNRSYRSAKWVARHAHNLYVRYIILGKVVSVVVTGISTERIEVYLPYYGITGVLVLPPGCRVHEAEGAVLGRGGQRWISLFSAVSVSLSPENKKIFVFSPASA